MCMHVYSYYIYIYIYRSIHIEIHFSPQEVKHSKVIRSTRKKCCFQEDVQFSKTQHRDSCNLYQIPSGYD